MGAVIDENKKEKKILGVKVYKRVDEWRRKVDRDPNNFGLNKSNQKDYYRKTLEYTAEESHKKERQDMSFQKYADHLLRYDQIQDNYRKVFGSGINDFKKHDVTHMDEATRKA